MANDLSRDDIDGLISQARGVLLSHYGRSLETECARDELEQIISSVAGQLSEDNRRGVAGFAERLISAVWSETISINNACAKFEQVLNAAVGNSSAFGSLIGSAVDRAANEKPPS